MESSKNNSFNCKHFYDSGLKFDFINKYISDCDLLFLQEHCLYKSQFCDITLLVGGMGVEAKSAMDESLFKEGSKYGGCAILWKPSVKGKVVPVACQSNRLCGILVNLLNNVTLLILYSYIPCDHRIHDHHEMEEVLREVQKIMLDCDANYPIFGGDLNTDIS